MDLKEIECEGKKGGLNSTESGQRPMSGPVNIVMEPVCSLKFVEFLDW